MSGKTAISASAANKNRVLAAGLFSQSMGRLSKLGQMSGKFPVGEAGAAATLKNRTTNDMPIVKAMDLSRGKGDEVEFQFLQPKGAYPIMGDKVAEGQGTGMDYDESRIRVNQARFPLDLGSMMTGIRSKVDFKKLGRPVAQTLMDSYMDQSLLVHLGGARGSHDNIEWNVPVESHPEFASMLVNRVKAPTKNRHFIADGSGMQGFAVNAGAVDLQTTDVLNMDVVDSIRTLVQSIALPPPEIKIPGDKGGYDSKLYMLMLSPAQFHAFAQDPNFRQFQVAASTRATQAENHPLFRGDVGMWNGILICQMPKPIRFYAGDTIRYCGSYTSEVESTCVVPDTFGTTHAVDRALLLGGQALAQGFAASDHGGTPFFWSEETFDHGNKTEILIGAVQGISKIRWAVEQGDGEKHFTDHGVIAIDTAVKIIAPRG